MDRPKCILEIIQKFRRAVLVTQVIHNLIKMYRNSTVPRAELLSFTELQFTGIKTETDDLLFDLSYFKAKMEKKISNEARIILSGPPENRSPTDIKTAMLSLRASVGTFSKYPVHIQEKLAKLGSYECFGPGRVIARQGQVPQNFYLILSGTAVVRHTSLNTTTGELWAQTSDILKAGKCFGDVAILTQARRKATVVCHDTVSLLAVSRQDFLNIFLNKGTGEGSDFMKFLNGIELLSGWPIQKLPFSDPRICVHTFFRSGIVITKDSKASSKIYVVKTYPIMNLLPINFFKSLLNLLIFLACTTSLVLKLWDLGNGNSVCVLTTLVMIFHLALQKYYRKLTDAWRHQVDFEKMKEEWGKLRVLKAVTLSKPQWSTKPSKSSKPSCRSISNEDYSGKAVIKQRDPGNKKSQTTGDSSKNMEPLISARPYNQQDPWQAASTHVKRATASTTRETLGKKKKDGYSALSQHMHIETLRAGDVFGLAHVVYEDTPSMTLISDGAECIVISQDFFRMHTDEQYLQKLSSAVYFSIRGNRNCRLLHKHGSVTAAKVRPYPSYEMLQEKMQDDIDWKAYKSLLLNGLP
ncbi:cyclic nucleotide-binding domain-containing protein 2-like [Ornithorhynchus anatinus]|uniref:cyclic nucleotide-binding domain-containing protein 2-like n=1 Tax=Ornithorhynchus anatinus TaxID=9258 RepID=UPI0019D43990|nr:cyclic nucleotide-binding domain-containing protein 2-like [Ornithorhynchus anatinus]